MKSARRLLPLAAMGLLLALAPLISGCGGTEMAQPGMRSLNQQELTKLAQVRSAQELGEPSKKTSKPLSPTELESHGDSLVAQREWPAALFQYGRALSLCKEADRNRIRSKMGEIYLRMREPVQAEAAFRALKESEPHVARHHQGLGLALLAQGKLGPAEAELRRAVEMDPGLWKAQNALGLLYNRMGRPEQALPHLRAALNERPRLAILNNNLGVSYMLLNELDAAEASFRKALALDPNFKLAGNNLGLVQAKRGRWQEALTSFTMSEGKAGAHNNLGCLLYWHGHREAAAEQFDQAMESNPRYYPLAKRHLQQSRQEPGQMPGPSNSLRMGPRQAPGPSSRLRMGPPAIDIKPLPMPAARGKTAAVRTSGHAAKGVAVGRKSLGAEKHEAHLAKSARVGLDAIGHGGQGHPGRLVKGVAVGAGGDAGEGHGAQAVARGQLQGAFVASGQKLGVAGGPAIYRPYRMNHLLGPKLARGGDYRLSSWASPNLTALGHDSRTAGPVNGPVHPAAAAKLAVGGVDDGVHRLGGDVPFLEN